MRFQGDLLKRRPGPYYKQVVLTRRLEGAIRPLRFVIQPHQQPEILIHNKQGKVLNHSPQK